MFCDSVYSKMPNRKKQLLNKDFMLSLKEEIIKLSCERDKEKGLSYHDYSNESYEDFYALLEGTGVFYKALENTSRKHNVYNAIFNYYRSLDWFDSDCFGADILYRLVELNLVDKESKDRDYYMLDYENDEDYVKYNLIHHYKGYDVVEINYWRKDSKKELEDIYSNKINKGETSIIWIDKKEA